MSSHTLYTPRSPSSLAHYERAAGFIAVNFPLAPIEAIESLSGPGRPRRVHRIIAPSRSRFDSNCRDRRLRTDERYIAVAQNSLLWLVHHNAIVFASWTPSKCYMSPARLSDRLISAFRPAIGQPTTLLTTRPSRKK
jgi:hypothetical protein